LLNVYDFDGRNVARLARKLEPSVSLQQAKKAIQLLQELNLVKKDSRGFFKPTEGSISTEDFIRNEAVKQFQAQSLELASSALFNESKRRKVVTTNTLSVSKKGRERIEKLIDRFRSQVRSLVHKDENPPEEIYQLDLLFFPLMK
jgi:uncharacterized protein (TIGR02147 family)